MKVDSYLVKVESLDALTIRLLAGILNAVNPSDTRSVIIL
jgi:hypothetical protein